MNNQDQVQTPEVDKKTRRKAEMKELLKGVGKILVKEVIHQLLIKFDRKFTKK